MAGGASAFCGVFSPRNIQGEVVFHDSQNGNEKKTYQKQFTDVYRAICVVTCQMQKGDSPIFDH